MAIAVGTDSATPKTVRWSGAIPVRTRAAPNGRTHRSTPLRKRPSNKEHQLLGAARRPPTPAPGYHRVPGSPGRGATGSDGRRRRPRLPHPPGARVERLRQDARAGHGGHEVRVARPPGDGVHVEVTGDAGAGGPTEVDADVDPVGPVGGPQRRHGGGHAGPQVAGLPGEELVEGPGVPDGHDHEVATGVGVGVEEADDAPGGVAPHDMRLRVRAAAGEQSAEHAGRPVAGPAVLLGGRLDVLGPPPGPQVLEAHAPTVDVRAATSAARAEAKSARGTPRRGRSSPLTLTPTVSAATSSGPTTST